MTIRKWPQKRDEQSKWWCVLRPLAGGSGVFEPGSNSQKIHQDRENEIINIQNNQ